MKTKLFILTLWMATCKLSSSQSYQWAFNAGGNIQNDHGQAIAMDGSGNTYVTGYFGGIADFDPGAGTANLTPAGSSDIFVAKYNATGAYQWAFRAGSTGADYGYGIAIDGSGNVYITGSFRNIVDFDPGAGTANLSSGGLDDIFVAKYNSAGIYQLAFRVGGTDIDRGNGIAVDSSGNVFVTGSFRNTVDFDPGAGATNLTSAGVEDIFVTKYNSAGVYQWAFNIGSTNTDRGNGIDVDNSGNVYVTGDFYGTADFDPGAGTANHTAVAWSDVFVAKYNSTGVYQWAINTGGSNADYGYAIAVDGNSNVHVTGGFIGTSDFDPGVGTANLTATGSWDIYVAKYTSAGAYQWAFKVGGSNNDRGYGIAIDGNGNVYVTGAFEVGSNVDFDPGPGVAILTSLGNLDIFVAKYTSSGAYQWAFRVGGVSGDEGNGIVLSTNGSCIHVTGYFYDTADLDPGTGTVNLTSKGLDDIFVAKYCQSTVLVESFSFTDYNITTSPNPFTTQATLQTDNRFNNATLMVYNSFGQKVKQIDNLFGQTIIFNRDNLPSGLFFIRMTQDSKVIAIRKLLITD